MSLALALVLVAQTSAAAPAPAPAKKLPPASFEVRADAKGGAAAKAWADELRGFMTARKDEFRAPRPGEKADVVVQVDSVAPAPNGSQEPTAKVISTPRQTTAPIAAAGDHERVNGATR